PVTSARSLHDALPISAQRLPARRHRGGQEYRRAKRHETRIHGNGAAARQRYAVSPLGAQLGVGDTLFTEEHHGRIRIEHFLDTLDRKSTRLNSSHVKI